MVKDENVEESLCRDVTHELPINGQSRRVSISTIELSLSQSILCEYLWFWVQASLSAEANFCSKMDYYAWMGCDPPVFTPPFRGMGVGNTETRNLDSDFSSRTKVINCTQS